MISDLLEDKIIITEKGGIKISLGLLEATHNSAEAQNLSGDDAIVEEVKTWAAANPNKKYFFISHDNGILFKCRQADLSYFHLKQVDENWKLPEEPDSNQKKIKELENRVNLLEEQKPQIKIDVNQKEKIELEAFGRPSDDEIYNFKEYLKKIYPIQDVHERSKEDVEKELNSPNRLALAFGNTNSLPRNKKILGITQGDIEKYKREYNEWLSFIVSEENSSDMLNDIYIGTLNIEIYNEGKCPANSLYMTLQSVDNLIFDSFKEEHIDEIKALFKITIQKKIPPPPAAPEAYYESYTDMEATFHDRQLTRNLNDTCLPPLNMQDNVFYHTKRRPLFPTNKIELMTRKFFHGMRGSISFNYFIPYNFTNHTTTINIKVIAENIPEPITKEIIIELDRSKKKNILEFYKNEIFSEN